MERMIKIRFSKDSFYGRWERTESDCSYILLVQDGEFILSEKRFRPDDLEEGKDMLLYTPEELCEGKKYSFYLEVITESFCQECSVPEFSARLQRLKENILSHLAADGSQVLNQEIIEDETLTALLKEKLGYDELIIQKSREPELCLEEHALYLQGENVQVQFYVDENQELQMTLLFLETELELFKNTGLEEVIVENPQLCLTSFAHIWNENLELKCGLNFLAELTLPVELCGADSEKKDSQCIRFGGSLEQLEAGVHFSGKNIQPLKSFAISDAGGCRYSLENPHFFANVDGHVANAWLEGEITRNEQTHVMRVKLPVSDAVNAEYKDPQTVFLTLNQAFSYIEGESVWFLLPMNFRSLPNVQVKSAGVVWMAPELKQEMYYLQIGGNGTGITLLPGKLELTNWNLMCRRREYLHEEQRFSWYSANLSGEFLIAGEKKIELGASISDNAEWIMYLECGEGNWFAALLSLLGIPTDEFAQRLSFIWKGAQTFSLDKVWLHYNPIEQKITSLSFNMYTDGAWVIIPSALSMERLEVAVTLTQNEAWSYDITIGGTIRIGKAEKAAEIFVAVPIQPGMTSLTLTSGEKGILLPSFEDILSLVGIGNGEKWIPADFWNLDDLRISKLEVTEGLVPQAYLQSFTFGVTTEKVYSFSLGNLEFRINKLEILLKKEIDKTLCFIGNGKFSLFGLDTDVQIKTNGTVESLVLYAKIDREKAKEISFQQMADSFVNTEEGKYENISVPEHFGNPEFEEASVYIDKTKELYFMSGKVWALGSAVFASVRQESENGYILAAVLDDDFTFAGISSGLAVMDSYLKIQKAGFLVSSLSSYRLSDLTMGIPAMSLSSSETGQIRDVLSDELPSFNGELHAGVFLYGTIAFTAPIFSNLIRLGSKDGELLLEANAYLPHEEEKTEVYAKINEFLLLGIFRFNDVSVRYCIQEEKQFDLSGTLSIEVGEHTYAFTGVMHIGENEGHFLVQTAQGIREPLGIPGFELKNLSLQIDITFPDREEKTSYTTLLSGSVRIGATELNGQLLMKENKVQVCRVGLEKPLDVEELFVAIFSSEIWPKGLLKLTIDEGVIYKAVEDCRIGTENYTKGFHLKSRLTLYGFSFGVEGTFDGDAFAIAGTAQSAISLGILNITGTRGTAGPGIKFKADKNEKILGLTGGIELFGEPIADVNLLGYDITHRCFKGSIQYSGDVELFKDAKISFTWEQEHGIHIDEFPMQFIDQTLDFASLLEQASKSDKNACGELVGLMFEKVVKTKFEITPSFGEVKDDAIVIELLPHYHVLVANKEIVAASMKKLRVNISKPDKIGISALAEMIVDTVIGNASSIAGQILSDSEGLVKLITAIGAVKGTEKAFEALICRGAKETINGMGELEKAQQFANIADSQATDGGSLSGVVEAAAGAGAATEGAQNCFDLADAFFGGLAAGFVFVGDSGETEHAQEHKKEAEKRKEEAKEAEDKAREAVRSMLVIRELQIEEKRVGILRVSWKEIMPDEMELAYHVVVEKNGVTSPEVVQTECQTEIAVPADEKTIVQVRVHTVLVYPEKGGNYTYIGETAQTTYTAGSPLELGIEKLPEAKAGQAYHLVMQARGGTAPYHYTAHGLPDGISMQGDILTGVPRFGGGEVLVDITVTDALQRSVTRSYWMSIK